MNLPEFIDTLNEKEQIKLATEFLEIGLPIWEEYVSKNPIEYIDCVVAMQHKIDKKIIRKVIKVSKKTQTNLKLLTKLKYKVKLQKLYSEIREPIVALEDGDFEIPLNVELILLSAYNLTEYLTGTKESSLKENLSYISINQSIDSITKSKVLNFDQTTEILNKYNKNAW